VLTALSEPEKLSVPAEPSAVTVKPVLSPSAKVPSLTVSVTVKLSAASLALLSPGLTDRPVSVIAAWFSVMLCASGVEISGVSATPVTVIAVVAVPWIAEVLLPSVEVTDTLSVSEPSYSAVGV
jgi:hypothetical protein